MALTKEIHTMIIWSNALHIVPIVEAELKSRFNVISQIEVCWDKDRFFDNLKVFYSHSQKHCSEAQYNRILTNKITHCGDGPFILFVYEDISPVYEYRVTSSGNRSVNSKVFDCKKKLRDQLGGGHKIHASDNTFESNKDLTLLLGLNTNDFLRYIYQNHQKIDVFKENCIGVDNYKNISQLFYVLNNSIKYCVIRNYECLPQEYTLEGHGDIDLLVEDLNYIKYLTLATSFYPDIDYRVHYGIRISNGTIPFDFRFVGDNYYDINWQNHILNHTTLFNSVIKVPDITNYFYSLLYHAYVQKRSVKPDYFERLTIMSTKLNLNYDSSLSLDKVKGILDGYLNHNNYDYTIPIDKTVYFNQLFLNSDSSRSDKFGELISTQQARLDDTILYTEVYDNGTAITKFGSKRIIENEIKFLSLLKETALTPKIINTNLEENNCFVTIEKLPGEQLDKAIENSLFWTKKNTISFLSQCVLINKVLIKHDVLHRDIRPENMLVHFADEEVKIHLIDFGWSTLISEVRNAVNPIGLGSKYKYAEGQYSDLFSTKKVIGTILKGFELKKEGMAIFDFKPSEYTNVVSLELEIEKRSKLILDNKLQWRIRDVILLWIMRNRVVLKVLLLLKRIFRIKLSH